MDGYGYPKYDYIVCTMKQTDREINFRDRRVPRVSRNEFMLLAILIHLWILGLDLH